MNDDKPKKKKKRASTREIWWFLGAWVLGNALAMMLFIVIFMTAISTGFIDTMTESLTELGAMLVFGVLLGVALASGQSVVINGFLPMPVRRWFGLTTLAGILIFPMMTNLWDYLERDYSDETTLLVVSFMMMLIMGSLQWIELRQHVKPAWLWIIANLSGAILFGVTSNILNATSFDAGWLAFGVSAATLALATGYALLWLVENLPAKHKKNTR